MKKLSLFFLLVATLFNYGFHVEASPTTLFWTNCIPDVQPTGTALINVDNFFTVFNRRNHGQILLPDVGILFGLFTWHDLSAEVGFDYLGGADDPLFFNGKVGMKEGKLFKHAPAFSVGMFGKGTRNKTEFRTNFNILDFVLGKSFEHFIIDDLYLGCYSGSKALGRVHKGFMAGISKSFQKEKIDEKTDFYRWEFVADWASGNNFIGGGGAAIIYYFTPLINIETGPVWFNTEKYNGKWKWGIQANLGFELFTPPKKHK